MARPATTAAPPTAIPTIAPTVKVAATTGKVAERLVPIVLVVSKAVVRVAVSRKSGGRLAVCKTWAISWELSVELPIRVTEATLLIIRLSLFFRASSNS